MKTGSTPEECRFKEAECRACKKKGHIAKACRSRPEGKKDLQTKSTKHLDATTPADDSDRDKVHETPVGESSFSGSQPEDVVPPQESSNRKSGQQRLNQHRALSQSTGQVTSELMLNCFQQRLKVWMMLLKLIRRLKSLIMCM